MLDVKKSSHKQIGKFLNVMRKAKVIDVQEKKGVITVTKVDLGNRNFKSLEEKFAGALRAAEAAGAAAAEAGAAEAGAGAKGADAPSKPPPTVTTVWKPTHYLANLFKAMDRSKDGNYPWEGAVSVLQRYIEKESLSLEGGRVKVVDMLIDSLWRMGGAQKKDITFPETAEMAEVLEKYEERMQEHTTIEVAGGHTSTRRGPMQKIE